MHNQSFFLCGLIFLCLLSGCILGSPEPGEVRETEISHRLTYDSPVSGSIAMIINDDVYVQDLANDYETTRLTQTPQQKKKKVALNYAKDKIAYVNGSGVAIIIDREGNLLETVTATGPVIDLGWSSNDETLYMLVDDHIEYHGPDMNLPSINAVLNESTFLSIDVSDFGDVIYCLKINNSISYYVGIAFKQQDLISISMPNSDAIKHVRISPDGRRFLIATSDEVGDYNKISFFESKPFREYSVIRERETQAPDFVGNGGTFIFFNITEDRGSIGYGYNWNDRFDLPTPIPVPQNYVSLDWKK